MPGPVPYGQSAQGGGEETGGEGVARSDGGDDVDAEGGDGGDGVGGGGGVGARGGGGGAHGVGARGEDGGAGGGFGPPGPGAELRGEDRRARAPPLHHEHGRLRQRRPDRLRADDPPRLLRLVLADEDQVGAAGQLQQDGGVLGAPAPQVGPVVDVERHQGPPGTRSGQLPQQGEAVGRQRGRDPGQVQETAGEEGLVRNVLRGHRGRGRARPVIGDLVRVGPPVGGRAEVDAGRTGRVAADGRGVDPVRRDRLDEVVAEAVRADPADPGRPVAGGGERAGHVGLGPADPAPEGGDVGEAAGLRGQERHHGLTEADDVGGRRGGGRPCCGSGHGGLLADRGAGRWSPLTGRRLGC